MVPISSSPVAAPTGRKRPLEPGPDPPEHVDKHPRTEIFTPSDGASRKHNPDPRDGDCLRRLHAVNRSVMCMLEGALNRDPNTDLTTLLKTHAQVYPSRRKRAEERALKALTTPLLRRESTSQPETASASASCTSRDPSNPRLSREAKRALQAPSGTLKIVKSLAPSVLALLVSTNLADATTESPKFPSTESLSIESIESELPRLMGRLIAEGEVLRHISGKVVVRVSDSMVVKLGTDMDFDQMEILSYVLQHTKKVPVPEPLGAFKIEDVSYVFMPRIEGTTLEMRWPTMTKEEKCTLRDSLEVILKELRQIPLPNCNLGWNDRCKDSRWYTRQSGPIVSEKEFNDFLLSSPLPRTTKSYLEMMRSRLRDDHQIVLTHGNLNPRNIMVREDLTIAGLIGWEMGGLYPEYWEGIKALNTFSATDPGDDWWEYIPQSIGLYHTEWAIDRQLETIVRC